MPKKTLVAAQSRGNEAIIQVKGNQPTLLAAVQQTVARLTPDSETTETTAGRNRVESRTVSVFEATALFASHPRLKPWAARVDSIIHVQRETACFDTASGEWPVRSENAYYVATATFPAERAAGFIRGHWAVENQNHYVPDVTLQEDASRQRAQSRNYLSAAQLCAQYLA